MADDRTALGRVMAALVRDVGVDAALGASIRETINRAKVQHDGASKN